MNFQVFNPIAEFSKRVAKQFEMDELEELAFEFSIEPGELKGSTRAVRARELVLYTNRRGYLGSLLALVADRRQHVDFDWYEGLSEYKPVPEEPTQEQTAVSESLNSRLRSALLDCGPFSNNAELSAVFVDLRLQAWQSNLPQADSPMARVERVIDMLYGRYAASGENGLVLLLLVLKERVDFRDACHNRLGLLAAELANELEANKQPALDSSLGVDASLSWFVQTDIHDIQRKLIRGGINSAGEISALLTGMDTAFTMQLSNADVLSTRLANILGTLNTTGRLVDGQLPIEVFLRNAISQIYPRAESTQLEQYLSKLSEHSEF